MTPAVVKAFEANRNDIRRLETFAHFDSKPKHDVIPAVVNTLWSRKGKRLRSHWVYWFGEMAGAAKERLDLYAWIVEAIHTASLLHDDVVDVAQARRGGPSANHLFGNAAAVLSGDYFLSEALLKLAKTNDTSMLTELCQALQSLSSGEMFQREQFGRVPFTEQPFIEISHLKTSALFEWAAIAGPTLTASPHVDAIRRFARTFGELFQFSDDVLDLKGGDGKDSWADLAEGRLNRASWWLLQYDTDLATQVRRHFNRGGSRAELIRLAQRSYADTEARKFIAEKLFRCRAQCHEALRNLPPHPLHDALSGLIALVVERVS